MERRYKAFISYRHKPLDIRTAVKLHRRIERYVIPEPLRINGEKKVGIVFRDLDELPISSNLSANVQEALDCSEYLIVICTPETPKSLWVLREIDYFLEHHDRDHVLAVLADGTPETSFPYPLTEIRTPDGEVLETIEPLAANIVADSPAKRRRLFQTESLRILAALIGCPYDALYRREERYRRRRTGLLTGIAAVIAAAFIGMLLNRNAKIHEQLLQTQISESRAFAALAKTAYADGDYQGALRYAVQALPDDENSRPYVPEAELALSQVLNPYAKGTLQYAQSFEQPSSIFAMDLSMDGKRAATVDREGVLHFFNTETGEQLWEQKVDIDPALYVSALPQQADSQRLPVSILEEQGAILVRGNNSVVLYSALTGEALWERNDLIGLNFAALSPHHRLAFATTWSAINGRENMCTYRLLDLEKGTDIQSAAFPDDTGEFCPAAVFSEDESCAAFLLTETGETSASLYFWRLGSGKPQLITSELPYNAGSIHYQLLFCENRDLILARDGSMYENSEIMCFDADADWNLRYETPVQTEAVAEVVNETTSLTASIDLLDAADEYLAFGSKHYLHMLSLESGEILWSQRLPGALAAAVMYDDAGLGLVLSNGVISFCTDEGYLAYQQGIYCFECGYDIAGAVAEGASFDETVFGTVPARAQKRVTMVRTRESDALTRLTERRQDTAKTVILVSPSGEQVLGIDYDPIGTVLRGRMLNPLTGEEELVQLSEEVGRLDNLDRLCLGDDGALYLTDMPDPTSAPEADRLPGNTVRVISACEDRLLLAFTGNGEIHIFDRQSGEMLHLSDYSDQNVMFEHHLSHYDVRESVNQKRLLIVYDDLNFNEARCIVIDEQTWETVGIIRGAAAYLPGTDSLLIQPYLQGTFRCPLFRMQDLISQAKQITEAQDP